MMESRLFLPPVNRVHRYPEDAAPKAGLRRTQSELGSGEYENSATGQSREEARTGGSRLRRRSSLRRETLWRISISRPGPAKARLAGAELQPTHSSDGAHSRANGGTPTPRWQAR